MRAILSEIKFLEQFVTCVKSMNNIRFLDNSSKYWLLETILVKLSIKELMLTE